MVLILPAQAAVKLQDLREPLRPGLRERQKGTRRMHGEPALRDGGFNRRAVFLVAAASIAKLPIDNRDRQPPGVIGLNASAISSSFAIAASGLPSGRSSLNFIMLRAFGASVNVDQLG